MFIRPFKCSQRSDPCLKLISGTKLLEELLSMVRKTQCARNITITYNNILHWNRKSSGYMRGMTIWYQTLWDKTSMLGGENMRPEGNPSNQIFTKYLWCEGWCLKPMNILVHIWNCLWRSYFHTLSELMTRSTIATLPENIRVIVCPTSLAIPNRGKTGQTKQFYLGKSKKYTPKCLMVKSLFIVG